MERFELVPVVVNGKNGMKKIIGSIAASSAAVLGLATSSHAALTLTGVTLNTADVESIMMLVIPALAALWGFRKIVKTMNRS